MNIRIHLLRSLSTQWLRFGTVIIVGIFLAPFILHRLGDEAFGLYVLVFSATGYFGLLDFGIGSSLVRYVAHYNARNEPEELNRFVNTAFFAFCALGLVVLGLSVVGATYVDSIFRISPEFHHSAQLLFLMVGAAIACNFPMGIFGGILNGLQRFSTLNLLGITGTLIRAALVVLVLTHGLGLLSVCLVTVGVRAIFPFINAIIVFRAIPLRLSWSYVNRSSFKLMANYSIPSFVISAATRFFFQADEVITGMFISAAAVTYFSIGSKLVQYGTGFTDAMADLLNPVSSHYDARGNLAALQTILVQGSRACAFTAFPFLVLYIILGKPIIEVWMGARYVSSYPVLLILMVPFTLSRAEDPTRRILYGMAKHSYFAIVRSVEGVVNVVLAILLAHHFGVVGVALGTAIPMMVTALFFYPTHLCRVLKVPLTRYAYEGFVPALVFCVPLAATLFLLKRALPVPGYETLAIQGLVGAAVYGSLVLWFFFTRDPQGRKIRSRLTQVVRHAISR